MVILGTCSYSVTITYYFCNKLLSGYFSFFYLCINGYFLSNYIPNDYSLSTFMFYCVPETLYRNISPLKELIR